MVETCREVQGIWALVKPVWIPTNLLSISDKQQGIIKQGMTVKHGFQRCVCGGAKSCRKSELSSQNCLWTSARRGQYL